MKIANISYSQWKTILTSKNLLPQYVENPDSYDLFVVEASSISWETRILKGSDDATDFETNYKNTSNAALEIKSAAGRPQRFSMSPQPVGTVEHWKGFQITIPAGQTSAYVDISFPSTVYIKGGYIVSADVDLDDHVNVDVLIAANNVIYVGGLIDTAHMIPNMPVSFESDESMMLPSSLKLRATLTTAQVDVSDVHANILVDYFI